MSFFVVPTFVPPTLEQLTREPDEVAIIVSQEARIAHEVRLHCNQAFGVRWSGPQKFHDTSRGLLQLADVRDYNREAAPLGVIPVQEELVSEQDEGLTSDEGRLPPHDTCLHS